MTTSNHRASLLAGLRTGGVRSTSNSSPPSFSSSTPAGIPGVPHTAAIGGSFAVPRFSSPSSYQRHQAQQQQHQHQQHNYAEYQPEDVYDGEEDGYSHHQQPFHANNQNSRYGQLGSNGGDANNNNFNSNGPFYNNGNNRAVPMTAAVDGPNNRFLQQQQQQQQQQFIQQGLNQPQGGDANPSSNQQAFQMQMMQLEILKLQALQAQQQYQADLIAQAQLLQSSQSPPNNINGFGRRAASYNHPPATAGPLNTSFNTGSINGGSSGNSATPSQRRFTQLSNLAEGYADDRQQPQQQYQQVPMTAALGGRFGGRRFGSEEDGGLTSSHSLPQNGSTTVISGGTSLGGSSVNTHAGSPSSNGNGPSAIVASKSDSATSWRRGNSGSASNGSTPARGHPLTGRPMMRSGSSPLSGISTNVEPSTSISPPPRSSSGSPTKQSQSPFSRSSPVSPISGGGLKNRPQPLNFSRSTSTTPVGVAIEQSDETDLDDGADVVAPSSSSGSVTSPSSSHSETSTPRSSGSFTSGGSASATSPLSPREEASKKLYEGLGVGRPHSAVGLPQIVVSENHYQHQHQQQSQNPNRMSGVFAHGPGDALDFGRKQRTGEEKYEVEVVAPAPLTPVDAYSFSQAIPIPQSQSRNSIPNYPNQSQTHSNQSHSTSPYSSTPIQSLPTSMVASSNTPTRQPRGPPSHAEELGPKNFASMVRRRASGGLGVLMGRVQQGRMGSIGERHVQGGGQGQGGVEVF